MKIKETKKGNL